MIPTPTLVVTADYAARIADDFAFQIRTGPSNNARFNYYRSTARKILLNPDRVFLPFLIDSINDARGDFGPNGAMLRQAWVFLLQDFAKVYGAHTPYDASDFSCWVEWAKSQN